MKKLYSILAVLAMTTTMNAGDVTVANGTVTSTKAPIESYNNDCFQHAQIIYPESYIEELAGKSIISMTFYVTSVADKEIDGIYTVSLASTTADHYDGGYWSSYSYDATATTAVYEGKIDGSQTTVTLTFSTPFEYIEGNLLVDIQTKSKGSNYADATYVGIEADAAVEVHGSGYSSLPTNPTGGSAFLPKTTFEYAEAGGSCLRPSKLTAAATPDGGVFTWQGEEGERYQYCVVAKDAEAADWKLLSADKFTCTVSGLEAGTEYDFHVRHYCSKSKQSSDAVISFTPACNAPANLRMDGLTHNSVTILWDAVAGISKYQFVCVRKGAEFEWAGVAAVAGESVKLDTLQSSTSYDFYLRSFFNDQTQSSAVKLSLTTNCVAVQMPYSENFDAEAALPTCWESEDFASGYGNSWSIGSEWSDEHASSPNSARYNGRSSSTTPADLKSPAIELTEHALLKFAYRNQVTAEVLIFDGSKETVLLNMPQDGWKTVTLDLGDYTGKIVNIIFRGHANNKSNYFYVDDVQIVAKPCTTPAKPKASASSDGALLTWTAGDDETVWNLRYREVAEEENEWIEVLNLSEPTYTLSGLEQEKTYEVQVQAACTAEKHSEWTASATFVPECPKPTNLKVAEVDGNSALISWESAEETFNVEYKAATDEDWTVIANVKGLSHKLTELAANTSYSVRVQAACEGEYSATRSFTTKCAALRGAIPFVEDFEFELEEGQQLPVLPDCWERRTEGDYPMIEATTAAIGSNCVHFYGADEQMLILPALDENMSELMLTLFYKVSSSSITFEVGYLTELYGEFCLIKTLANDVYAYEETPTRVYLNNAPAAAKYLAIRYTSTSAYVSAYVDDIKVLIAEDQTAVETIATTTKAAKRIVDGHLFIEQNGNTYNAQGVSVR